MCNDFHSAELSSSAYNKMWARNLFAKFCRIFLMDADVQFLMDNESVLFGLHISLSEQVLFQLQMLVLSSVPLSAFSYGSCRA